MDAIKDAINQIDEEISELQNRKAYLQSLDTSTVPTEDEWHEICLSPLRGDDALGLFVKNIFPEAENITVKVNNVIFYISGVKCYLPTSAIRGISVDVSEFKKIETPQKYDYMYTSNRLFFLRKYMHENNSWREKMELLMPKRNPFLQRLCWIFWYKNKDIKYKEEWAILEDENEQRYLSRYNTYSIRREKYTHKCQILKDKVEPVLRRFTDNIYLEKDNLYGYDLKTLDDLYKYYNIVFDTK